MERPKQIIRGQEMSVGDKVHWMSGGTWDGIIRSIKPEPSGKHTVIIKATDGTEQTLSYAEDYGISLGTSRHIDGANKPSYDGWEKDWGSVQCAESFTR
jgi:hypothetical protein